MALAFEDVDVSGGEGLDGFGDGLYFFAVRFAEGAEVGLDALADLEDINCLFDKWEVFLLQSSHHL